MPTGYLVSLGGNNTLNSGDVISGGAVTFVTQTALGPGQWVWSGTYRGTTCTNMTEPGWYHLGTDGNVYFVPDYGPVDMLTSSSVSSAPTSAPTMDKSGDGTGDVILTFRNDESVTLVGVAPSQVDSQGELHAMGIPGFVRGSRIDTPRGEVAVEDLRVGDSVWTRDRGAQTIRWIGSRRVAATGPLAPVLIPEGALGNIRDTRVFPQHRMLIAGWQAELYYGEAEVLVAAKHLVDGAVIRSVPGGEVEYFHILFDQHEIVLADGAPSESCYPCEGGWAAPDAATRAELLTLFPELEVQGPASYGPTARRSLKAHEAALLRPASPKTSATPISTAIPA